MQDATQERLLIADAVRKIAAKYPDQYWMEHDDEKRFPKEFFDAFVEAGLLGITIPEEYGGMGLGISEAGIALREIAESGAAMNGCSTVHFPLFGSSVIAKYASEEMKREVLPKIVSGEIDLCFAVTEADAGTDTTRIKTFARREDDKFIINGRKLWISKAQVANTMILLARTTRYEDCDKPSEGITLILLDLNSPGITITPINKMGRNAVDSNEVFFDDVMVPANSIIGEEGLGFRHILDSLNPERILLSYEAIGIGRVALKKAVNYANERVVFDRPIGKNQGIQFPLAQAHMRLAAAELMADKAADLYDQGLKCGEEANTAKYLAGEAAFFAADRALQTHGGLGYAKEFHVERYFREARLFRLAPISEEMILNYISEHVLGLPRSY